MDMHATLMGPLSPKFGGRTKSPDARASPYDMMYPACFGADSAQSPSPRDASVALMPPRPGGGPGVKAVRPDRTSLVISWGRSCGTCLCCAGTRCVTSATGSPRSRRDARRRRRSALRIDVDYEVPAVFDPMSHATGCPLLHDDARVLRRSAARRAACGRAQRSNAAGVGQRRCG